MASLSSGGEENYNLRAKRPGDVLDRRFDGYLPDEPEHSAQDSILPMTLYCFNEKCKKYGNTSLGSCFLIEELNKDKRCGYLYFATAAHNLYCRFCENYRWVKPILKWAAGQPHAGSFLLGTENRGVSKRGFHGWMKVSDGYIKNISERRNSKERSYNSEERFSFDYGILAVKIAGIDHAESYATTVRMYASPPERHEFVELAYLCGYPGEVCNKDGKVPPQGAPANAADLEYMGPKRLAGGYYKWKVQGGRFWMPPDRSSPGQESAGAENPEERHRDERRTAALYPLPQMHQRVVCDKQNSALSKERLYRHYIDSSKGQSGSPVYIFKSGGDQQCVAVGIHVGLWKGAGSQKKEMGFNVAVRLHGDVLSEMERWVSDPNNKATDIIDTNVDIREGTEEFDLGRTLPTFFGSDMAAVLQPSQERHVNPWQSTEYRSNYELLIKRMTPTQVLGHMEVLELIGYYEKEEIEDKHPKSAKNSAILESLQVVRAHFGKFREMLRRYPKCKEIAEEMDLVGPDPKTDSDCKAAREMLEAKDK